MIPRINTTTCGKHGIINIGPVIWSKFSIHIYIKSSVRVTVSGQRTTLELTPVRTVTCVTLRIINEAGRVSEPRKSNN